MDQALKEEFPDAGLNLSESSMVEPFFGRKFLTNGIKAISLGAVAILGYVWFRFRRIGGLSAGFMALLAICIDLLVVYTVYIIFQASHRRFLCCCFPDHYWLFHQRYNCYVRPNS
jgi:preprotein translocase subunit SecF